MADDGICRVADALRKVIQQIQSVIAELEPTTTTGERRRLERIAVKHDRDASPTDGKPSPRSDAHLAALAAKFGSKPFTAVDLVVLATPYPISATGRMQNLIDRHILRRLFDGGLINRPPTTGDNSPYKLTDAGLRRAKAATRTCHQRYPSVKSPMPVRSTLA
jgi:hypothetical protein